MLICPVCQTDGHWATDLDRCEMCASIHLVKRLGEVECRDCGAVGAESASGAVTSEIAGGAPESVPAGLAEEVERALARVLRWPSARPAGIG